jgi:hypothetical protein
VGCGGGGIGLWPWGHYAMVLRRIGLMSLCAVGDMIRKARVWVWGGDIGLWAEVTVYAWSG